MQYARSRTVKENKKVAISVFRKAESAVALLAGSLDNSSHQKDPACPPTTRNMTSGNFTAKTTKDWTLLLY